MHSCNGYWITCLWWCWLCWCCCLFSCRRTTLKDFNKNISHTVNYVYNIKYILCISKYKIQPRATASNRHWMTSWIFESNGTSSNHYNVFMSNSFFRGFSSLFWWRIEWNSTTINIGRTISDNGHFISIFIFVKTYLAMGFQNTRPLKMKFVMRQINGTDSVLIVLYYWSSKTLSEVYLTLNLISAWSPRPIVHSSGPLNSG